MVLFKIKKKSKQIKKDKNLIWKSLNRSNTTDI